VTIPEADVRAEVDRILASKGFASAGRLSRLLRYVVEKTIAGESDQLKEYAVGVEVFDRGGSYDPRLDSIVRVEAGRLRGRLDEYYSGEGAGSPIRISLPRGGYVAQFERIEKPGRSIDGPSDFASAAAEGQKNPSRPGTSRQAATSRSWATFPLTAGLILAVAAMVVWLGGWNRTPAQVDNADVVVLPFSSDGGDAALAARLTETVTTELARLNTVSVASHTSAVGLGQTTRPLREIASTLNVNYAVEASIEPDGEGLLVMARIVSAETDRKIWVADYRGRRDEARTIAQRIAFDVSSELVRRRPR
jgi:TolB-like protein